MHNFCYKKIRKKLGIFISVFMFLVTAFFCCLNLQVLAQCEIGSPAPDFSLMGLDGKMYQLNPFKNQQDFILLTFLKGNNSDAIDTLENIIIFFEDCHPKESYQIIAVLLETEDQGDFQEKCNIIQRETKIPLLVLVENGIGVMESYQIEGFPTMVLLRDDLCVAKMYSKFTTRQERMFYQYLRFIFSCQREDNNGCEGGVCPPPPGYE